MSTTTPTISVIIPLYNKQKEIMRTLDSVMSQTVTPLEVLVVNDGSTDNGPAIVRQAINQHSRFSRVRTIDQVNGGVSKARNTGITEAKGSYVTFIDADDSWLPGYLETILMLVDRYPEAKAYGTGYFRVSGRKKRAPKIRLPYSNSSFQLITQYFDIVSRGDLPIIPGTLCVERELIMRIGGFPEGEPMGEDQDAIARLALCTSFGYCSIPQMQYHLDASNRACVRNLPREELPFSKRLYQQVASNQIDKSQHSAILRYNAAHLLYLAEQLIYAGDCLSAHTILKDHRVKYLPIKYIRAYVRLLVKKTLNRFKQLVIQPSVC